MRFAIVASRYNGDVMTRLLDGAEAEFLRCKGAREHLAVVRVPGAFELPVACAAAARSGEYDAVVALGCLIKGETDHDRVIADAVANGLVSISLETGVPVLFGVLTVNSMEQALARAGGEAGNKGAEAVAAAIESVQALRAIAAPRGSLV